MRQFIYAALFFVLTANLPAHAQFPREGIAEIPNGIAAPFEGVWEVGFPIGEGMINGEPPVTCDDPVHLTPNGTYNLIYASPTGEEVTFELTEFSGRTTWFPPAGESIIAVWTSKDEFYSYSVDLTNGRARWDNPLVYRRCIK